MEQVINFDGLVAISLIYHVNSLHLGSSKYNMCHYEDINKKNTLGVWILAVQ